LGTEGAYNFGGYFNAGLISTYGYRTNQGHFHRTSTDYFAPVTFVPDMNGLVGTVVCQSGWKWTGMSGDLHPSSRCGSITTISYDLNNLYPAPAFEPAFIRATMKGDHGDSGAAIVWNTIYGYGAVSVLHGGPNAGDSPVISSRMDYILYIWGLQLTPF